MCLRNRVVSYILCSSQKDIFCICLRNRAVSIFLRKRTVSYLLRKKAVSHLSQKKDCFGRYLNSTSTVPSRSSMVITA